MSAFVIPSAANPMSQLSNQFRKSRIYARSGICRARTLTGCESGKWPGVATMSA
jgi:hypothetical protein